MISLCHQSLRPVFKLGKLPHNDPLLSIYFFLKYLFVFRSLESWQITGFFKTPPGFYSRDSTDATVTFLTLKFMLI